MPDQQIRFCTTSDGVRIAYGIAGDGPPVVFCPGIYSHIELDWEYPWRRAWFEGLARACRLIRFDSRGTGLSQRGDLQMSAETLVADLEAVVDQARLERFALGGIVLGGATAMMYAARHPEKVSHLVLFGTANRGNDLYTLQSLTPLLSMARSNWPMARLLASGLSTGAVSEDVRRGDEAYVNEAIDGETFARLLELAYSLDLTAISEQVNVPALVIHQRDDKVVPLEFAKRLASCLANSRFLSVDGDSAVPWHGGSTQQVLDAVIEFCELPLRRDADRKQSHLRTVLFTDLVGHTEMMSRLGDESGRVVLREHERITREMLKQYDGTEVKTMGDGFMASFGSVTRAVECAVALQQAFARREGESILVRVGLAAGEPIEEDGDLFGATVILASRIAERAEAGEILVANAVRELCAGKGFLFSDRGEFVAKGFEDPVRLFQASWD